jgi:hypothetical protein
MDSLMISCLITASVFFGFVVWAAAKPSANTITEKRSARFMTTFLSSYQTEARDWQKSMLEKVLLFRGEDLEGAS